MRQATIGWDGRRRVIGAVASPLGDKTRGPVHLRRRPSERGFSSGTPMACSRSPAVTGEVDEPPSPDETTPTPPRPWWSALPGRDGGGPSHRLPSNLGPPWQTDFRHIDAPPFKDAPRSVRGELDNRPISV
jgi:hypothetical protein